MLIDTHAHLWDGTDSVRVKEILERASEEGVEKIIVPGDSYKTSKASIELAKEYPGKIYAAVGYYPGQLKELSEVEQTLKSLRKLIAENREWVVAIGEIGLDAYYMERQGEIDKEIFRRQLELAMELNLPVVVHNRGADEEIREVLGIMNKLPVGHFHCFSGTKSWLKYLMDKGFYVGLCGNVTYKANRELREVIKEIPENRLLLETDTPYLPPQGKRGEKNEPCNVKITAQVVAETRGTTLTNLEKVTAENAVRLYKL